MTSVDFTVLLPVIVLSAASVAVMLAIALSRSHLLTVVLTTAGFAVAFFCLFSAVKLVPRAVTPLIVVDGYSLFYSGLILLAGLAVSLLSYDYFDGRPGDPEEFYLLLLLATLGAVVLVSAAHFASFFLGLELLSVSLYAMVAYDRSAALTNEAGLKYLVLAGVSSAFLLLGMALVYYSLGTMEFSQIAAKTVSGGSPLAISGLALTAIGIGFKLALVPFHMWTPDVYEGAPAPAAAYVATVSKGAVFALLLRYLGVSHLAVQGPFFVIFSVAAIASMLAGNLLALYQQNVKRILAYSSIAHLGYLLVAFVAGGEIAASAAAYYLTAYFATMLGAFGVVTVLSGKQGDADSIEDYRGLAMERPWLAAVFAAMLFSLAGIPLTAGFIGKFYVVAAGANSARWVLVIVLVAGSVIGLYYYLRIVAAMFLPAVDGVAVSRRASSSGMFVIVSLAVAVLWLGTVPSFLIGFIRLMMP